MRTKQGVVLAVEKRVTSPLLVRSVLLAGSARPEAFMAGCA